VSQATGELDHARAVAVFDRIAAMIGDGADPAELAPLGDALDYVAGKVPAQQVIDLVKYPGCVGVVRTALVESMAKRAGVPFDGDRWRVARWAEGVGLDTRRPPERPPKPVTTTLAPGTEDRTPTRSAPPRPETKARRRAGVPAELPQPPPPASVRLRGRPPDRPASPGSRALIQSGAGFAPRLLVDPRARVEGGAFDVDA
jgi:hypothetical protein